MIKNKLKQLCRYDYFTIIIYIIIISLIHIPMKKSSDDITLFSNVLNNMNLLEFCKIRYQTWSSRLIIEAILVIFADVFPMYIWKIANIGMYILLIYSINKLFIYKNRRFVNFILCICMLLIPMTILKEAGWMATMNNYLWVASKYRLICNDTIKKVNKKRKNIRFASDYIYSSVSICN